MQTAIQKLRFTKIFFRTVNYMHLSPPPLIWDGIFLDTYEYPDMFSYLYIWFMWGVTKYTNSTVYVHVSVNGGVMVARSNFMGNQMPKIMKVSADKLWIHAADSRPYFSFIKNLFYGVTCTIKVTLLFLRKHQTQVLLQKGQF